MSYTKNDNKYTIIKERVEIFEDFTLTLLNYIYKYYIDKESLSDDVDIKNHYSWCYKKTCDEFLVEEIDFRKNDELNEYYYAYYYSLLYKKEENLPLIEYEIFWKNIFDIDNQKNKTFINMFIEVYKIYDKSINKNENILEII